MRAQATIVIDRPIEAVFECITSVKFIHRWFAPLRSEKDESDGKHPDHRTFNTQKPPLRQLPEGTIGSGTLFLQSNESSTHPLEAVMEVMTYTYPTAFSLDIKLGTHISRIEFALKATTAGTQISLLLRPKQQHRVVKFVDSILSFTQRISNNSPYNLHDMKNYIEEQC